MSRAGLWGLSTLTATLLSACFFPEVDLEGRACAVNEDCLTDYVCQSSICVRPASSDSDAGAPVDAGSDGGSADSGTFDAGAVDAGRDDAGHDDAGLDDAGRDDAGLDDAGLDDAGLDDAGLDDAGPDDAGQDAGPLNVLPTVESVTPTITGVNVELLVVGADTDGTIASLVVDWGDGSAVTEVEAGSPATVTHAYSSAATFVARVRVIDDRGGSSAEHVLTLATLLPTDGLILHLPFNGNHDDVINSIAVSFNGVENYAGDRFSVVGRALTMHESGETGNQALVSTANLANRGFSESISVAIWVNLYDTFSLSDDTRIAGEGNWFNLYSDDGTLVWGILDGSLGDSAELQLRGPALVRQEWKLLVGVVEKIGNDSQLSLYVDGQLVAAELVVGRTYLSPTSCRFYVGNFPDNLCTGSQAAEFSHFRGIVDDVRVYARALSAAEVLALFNEEAP